MIIHNTYCILEGNLTVNETSRTLTTTRRGEMCQPDQNLNVAELDTHLFCHDYLRYSSL